MLWCRQVWLVRMLVMKHWKCNIVPEYCKTSHKTRTILEAKKKDSLVSGTEERKSESIICVWLWECVSSKLHVKHCEEGNGGSLGDFLQVWLELWHSCMVTLQRAQGSHSTTSQNSTRGSQGCGGQVVQYSASRFCTTTTHFFCLNRVLDTVLQDTQNISFSVWNK